MGGKRYYIEDDNKLKKIAYISGIILLISCVALIFVLSLYKEKSEADSRIAAQRMNEVDMEIVESTTSLDDKSINEVIAENSLENEIEITVETSKNNNVNKTDNKTKEKSTNKKVEKKKELKFQVPVKGEILRDFADTNLVYSDTLEEWTSHLGVDILADKGSAVSASESGTVKSIKNDPRYGLTVTIDHGDGLETVYASLLSCEFVSEGDSVEKGQTIATVGNSAAFEVADEFHLHFEMLKDGKNVNPTTYFK